MLQLSGPANVITILVCANVRDKHTVTVVSISSVLEIALGPLVVIATPATVHVHATPGALGTTVPTFSVQARRRLLSIFE